MKLKIEKIVGDDGMVRILINDKPIDYVMSCTLTGTISKSGGGIFNQERIVEFIFGEFKREFKFEELNKKMPIDEYADEIMHRIEVVSEWVIQCKETAGTAIRIVR